jgi:hypothetical protein
VLISIKPVVADVVLAVKERADSVAVPTPSTTTIGLPLNVTVDADVKLIRLSVPPAAVTNEKSHVALPEVAAKAHVVRDRDEPVQARRERWVPPRVEPASKRSCPKVTAELVSTSAACDPSFCPTTTRVFSSLPFTTVS